MSSEQEQQPLAETQTQETQQTTTAPAVEAVSPATVSSVHRFHNTRPPTFPSEMFSMTTDATGTIMPRDCAKNRVAKGTPSRLFNTQNARSFDRQNPRFAVRRGY
jgi:hypothetical protein